jgi:hypothetical protein
MTSKLNSRIRVLLSCSHRFTGKNTLVTRLQLLLTFVRDYDIRATVGQQDDRQ